MHSATRHARFLGLLAALLCLPAAAAPPRSAPVVAVEIVEDGGRVLPRHPARQAGGDERHYIEARQGERYAVRVRNLTGGRVGLVIAVDGRNIVSGERSELAPSERMYILDAYETVEYEGWRTDASQVHRFFFAESDDSYAAAFGDRSAMGVIAVAAYRERLAGVRIDAVGRDAELATQSGSAAPSAAERSSAAKSQPGTGFGESHWSPVTYVSFDPEPRPATRVFLKYEWREALCARGILACDSGGNRFWSEYGDGGFAPYPPGY